jgi:hypothetical protein
MACAASEAPENEKGDPPGRPSLAAARRLGSSHGLTAPPAAGLMQRRRTARYSWAAM